MRELINRIIDWVRRDKLERELAEELRFHRTQLERDALGAGTSRDEAPYAAKRQLGNITRVNEQARDRWSLPPVEQVLQDVRYALRGLRRAPGFTTTVVLTLALGIGANTAMFGVVDRLMFRPFAYLRDPSTAHRVYLEATYRGERNWGYGGEYTRYLDFRKLSKSFSQWAAFTNRSIAVGVGDAAKERQVGLVSASFFEFFDAPPALGRYFTAAEDSIPRGADVAVLGYGYWKSEYGGRNVLGEHVQVGQLVATIIGVAPEGFAGVNDLSPPAVYIPITLYAGSVPNDRLRNNYYRTYNWGWMSMMARRKPGVSMTEANADITQAWRQSWSAEYETDKSLTPIDIAKPAGVVGSLKLSAGPSAGLEARTSLWLTGVAVIVLLIACANVANLFLARALRRQREIAVRLALGVSRARLIRQTLIESLVLSSIGSVAGLLVAQWGGAGIRRLLITTQNASLDVLTDWRTIMAVIGAALFAGLLTGLAPALLSGRGDLARSLKAGAREGTYHRSRTRVTLLVAQGALSVMLLVGAGLFVRSLSNVKAVRLGFDSDPVVIVEHNLRGMKLDSAQTVALYERALLEKAQSLPGVQYAAVATSMPLSDNMSTGIIVAGIDSVRQLGRFTYQSASPDYLKVMGTRLLRGRDISVDDRAMAPKVAVVSEAMAKVLWPGKDAIGQCMKVGGSDTLPCTTIVGIAEDIVQMPQQLSDPKRYQYYLPIAQKGPAGGEYIVLKGNGAEPVQVETVRRALQALMPGPSYVSVSPMRQIVDGARRSWQLGATLFVAFGGLALLVAAIGLYGVIAYNVNQRMHELGVRVALGAQRDDILRLVMGQGARFALAGIVTGLGVSLAASKFIEPLLFKESAKDPVIYVVVAGVMLLVAVAASAAPAARAAGADPNRALRSE